MPGALCISIDLELGWGIWDRPNERYYRRCVQREQAIVGAVLQQLVDREISATWAVVARLLELDETVSRSTPHGQRLWYAPDLVEQIRTAAIAQDLGSHSYAHVYFASTPREAVRKDLEAARRVHDRVGLPFTSFVFPRNQVGHLDLLREAGVRVFRSVDRGWHTTIRNRVGQNAGRLAHLLDNVLPIPPEIVQPVTHGPLVELPSSMLLMARNGLRRAIPPQVLIAKARSGLEAAGRTGGIFHLWFHPSNFYYETRHQLQILEAILDSAVRSRERGDLEIRPMSSYALPA